MGGGTDRLAWIRAALFLNLLFPSPSDFAYNNMYITYTVSNFVLIYLLVPLIYKKIKSFDKAAFLFVVSLAARILWYIAFFKFWVSLGYDEQIVRDVCFHSFGDILPLVAAGVMVYYGMKEQKLLATMSFSTFSIVFMQMYPEGEIMHFGYVIFLLTLLLCFPVSIPRFLARIANSFAAWTFPIYMTHMTAFTLVGSLANNHGNAKYLIYLAGVAATAAFAHFCIEKPGAKLLKTVFLHGKSAATSE